MEVIKPEDIEKRSLEIIDQELTALRNQREAAGSGHSPGRTPLEEAIIRRAIHTTADFDFDVNMIFTHNAAEKAYELLRGGCTVVTDTNMALAGLNKTSLAGFGGGAHCFMAEEETARAAREKGATRAEAPADRVIASSPPLS